ncbi:MAG: hypothetical protein KDD22_06610, partial [Bdellovibrionales bacterium]|nr:hypothetical protein [Bdellovibrionales bacterium]
LQLIQQIPWALSGLSYKERLKELARIEEDISESDSHLNNIKNQLRWFARQSECGERQLQLKESLQSWIEKEAEQGPGILLGDFSKAVLEDNMVNLKALRDIENQVQSHAARLDIKLKLIRTLKSYTEVP